MVPLPPSTISKLLSASVDLVMLRTAVMATLNMQGKVGLYFNTQSQMNSAWDATYQPPEQMT